MDTDKLVYLLLRDERGTLEFKREWYKIDSSDKVTTKRERGELIKDILSLANGNAIVAGEEAYLIVGASDKLNTKGGRDLFDVGDVQITAKRILDIVNRLCDPPLEEIYCETVSLGEKRLLVVAIPPTPHLYETTDKLETPKRDYDKHTVFVRHSEGIDTASAKEREKILKLKQITFSERRAAPPLPFGAAVGALVGSAVASSLAGEKLVASKQNWLASSIVGMSVGGFIGGCSGYVYQSYYEIRSDWFRIPRWLRLLGVGAGLTAASGFWFLSRIAQKEIKKRIKNARVDAASP
jgi:hypothetical protein